MSEVTSFDVVIVGGGMVGASLAVALGDTGLFALVDQLGQRQQVLALLPEFAGVAEALLHTHFGDQTVNRDIDGRIEAGHIDVAAVGARDAQGATVSRRLRGEGGDLLGVVRIVGAGHERPFCPAAPGGRARVSGRGC